MVYAVGRTNGLSGEERGAAETESEGLTFTDETGSAESPCNKPARAESPASSTRDGVCVLRDRISSNRLVRLRVHPIELADDIGGPTDLQAKMDSSTGKLWVLAAMGDPRQGRSQQLQ